MMWRRLKSEQLSARHFGLVQVESQEDTVGKYTGSKAVVTGGTHGMGLAAVNALLDEGAQVLLTGRNEQNIDAARRELGSRAHVVRSDIANLTNIDALAVQVKEKLGRIDFLFINAGVSELGPFDRLPRLHTIASSTSTPTDPRIPT